MNNWPDTDGILPEFENGTSSSEIVAEKPPGARIVKALSHLGYHELLADSRPIEATDRHDIAIAVAGDDPDSVVQVSGFVGSLGFDPVHVGALDQGVHFGPSMASFGISVTAGELAKRIDDHRRSSHRRLAWLNSSSRRPHIDAQASGRASHRGTQAPLNCAPVWSGSISCRRGP